MKNLIFWILAIKAELIRHYLREECPDASFGELCESFCFNEYENCDDACESKFCESGCLIDYVDCFRKCPCEKDCPDGCDGCSHSICTCKNLGLDNQHYKQCVTKAMNEQNESAIQAQLHRPDFREEECPDASIGELCTRLA